MQNLLIASSFQAKLCGTGCSTKNKLSEKSPIGVNSALSLRSFELPVPIICFVIEIFQSDEVLIQPSV